MNLGQFVAKYRIEHELSQRQFANICGLSNGYISMLEKNMNPKTQQPLVPSIPALKKIAAGMGITLNELFQQVDDMPVDIGEIKETQEDHSEKRISPSELPLTEGEELLLHLFRQVPDDQQKMVLQMIRAALGISES